MRGNNLCSIIKAGFSQFQFTPLHERQHVKTTGIRHINISIHASTWEATVRIFLHTGSYNISIHASTWEAAQFEEDKFKARIISIHASTWEATYLLRTRPNPFIFQFMLLHERQHWFSLCPSVTMYFNSRLYMRGSMCGCILFWTKRLISIHASAWEATCLQAAQAVFEQDFNSRLCMRGNSVNSFVCTFCCISIHASAWEATERKLFYT